jgi:hypothetical protein
VIEVFLSLSVAGAPAATGSPLAALSTSAASLQPAHRHGRDSTVDLSCVASITVVVLIKQGDMDDAMGLAYVAVLPDEKQATTVGFLLRAVACFDG